MDQQSALRRSYEKGVLAGRIHEAGRSSRAMGMRRLLLFGAGCLLAWNVAPYFHEVDADAVILADWRFWLAVVLALIAFTTDDHEDRRRIEVLKSTYRFTHREEVDPFADDV